ncbi:hypothetical protein [Lewinella sp. W8]|uniref:hypothetical protein n=1 Tax=Lewinella sp. W8 TaxID=2528208 RepID=UPI001068686C|nr:hypothetical protein [Lewinella sp. W8]MTB52929.1 hypothetical protein [Lewinella sp. W8]
MATLPKYPKYDNPRENRLAKEHRLIHEFCEQSDVIEYEAKKRRGHLPPERYLIHYNIRSIVGVDKSQMPIFGERHTAEIIIPKRYPLGGQPGCWMRTPVWHPNIKFGGPIDGKICVNEDALGSWHTLDMMIERIGEILQYRNYHALNTPPHPEDANVATWVREFAEPAGIVDKARGKFVDNTPLLRPDPKYLESRKEQIRIIINRPREKPTQPPAPDKLVAPKRKKVVIDLK